MITPLEIIDRLDAYTLASTDTSPRKWLGASEIGTPCIRSLWYKFRFCGSEKFSARMLRLFDRGRREEADVVRLLRGAGFEVHTPEEGNDVDFQFSDLESHFRGTMDGVILLDGEWAVLEIKTYALERFTKLKRVGVQDNDPKYWSQLHTYAGQKGLNWFMFFARCKDNDDIFIQLGQLDRQHFEVCLSKAETVINSPYTSPPEKISHDPNTFQCRYCSHAKLCHGGESIPTSNQHCRNCIHASPAAAGTWECGAGHAFGTLCGDYRGITGPA